VNNGGCHANATCLPGTSSASTRKIMVPLSHAGPLVLAISSSSPALEPYHLQSSSVPPWSPNLFLDAVVLILPKPPGLVPGTPTCICHTGFAGDGRDSCEVYALVPIWPMSLRCCRSPDWLCFTTCGSSLRCAATFECSHRAEICSDARLPCGLVEGDLSAAPVLRTAANFLQLHARTDTTRASFSTAAAISRRLSVSATACRQSCP